MERFPDRVAFRLKTLEGYRQVTYREVHRQATGTAAGLRAQGLRHGERVAILSENRPEWVVSYLGILFAGGTPVPLDVQISPPEWRTLLDDSEARFVFVSGLHLPKLREALEGSPLRERWICFDPLEDQAQSRSELSGFVRWALSLNRRAELPESRLTDLVFLIYTSGTTGRPKGVMLTQENLLAEITAVLRIIPVDEDDTLLCLLPLQHVLASVINVLIPLYVGAQVTFVDTLKRSEILQALEEAGITILATVPQFFYLFHGRIQDELARKPGVVRLLFRAMLAVNGLCIRLLGLNLGRVFFGRIHRTFGTRLRMFVSGGSSFDRRVARDFHDMGLTILQGYGLTETTGAATTTRIEDNVIGSVGKPIPGVETRIIDPDDNGIGEVAIRGRIVMKGYSSDPDATAEVMRDDWLLSGDLGRLDDEGNHFITGRKKEVIVLPNGKNIYPDELETHYLQSPYINEIAVIGIAAPGGYESAERLHAVVVPDFDRLKAKKIANTREILRDEIGSLSQQLPKYKRLMSYRIRKDPLPRTTTRKIKRLELKALVERGEPQGMEAPGESHAPLPGEQELRESSVGREVLRCLRETHHRAMTIDLGMNLELDLGFDSMERVELLAALEQGLGLRLPEDFGAEIYTVRDLITRLREQEGASCQGNQIRRRSWNEILSERPLAREQNWPVRFSGHALTLAKYLGMRLIYLASRLLLRLEVRGIENVPPEGPYIICPNHLSYIDPFVVMSVLPYRIFHSVFFVGYSEYFRNRPMKLLARLANIVSVDADAHLLRAMRIGACGLRQRRILCIFPEGGRAFDGKLQEFKKGAAILSRETRVPIVPVGIRGTYEVWPRDSWKIRLHKVKLAFGKPVPPAEAASKDTYEEETQRLRDAVARLI